MYDCHLHTDFSYDSRMPIKSVCELSLAHGMKGICLTDHVELQAPGVGDARVPGVHETEQGTQQEPPEDQHEGAEADYGPDQDVGLDVHLIRFRRSCPPA